MAALCLAATVLFVASVVAAPVRAQQPVTLASLQISIWPEFDRPASLVILDGLVAAGVTLPAQLTVRMPAAATAPNAVAITGADGSLLQAAYTTVAEGGDIIIKFTTPSAAFRVEYYDPGLVISGHARSFAFRWKSDYAVAQAILRVQEPVGASNLTGKPALTPAGAGEYGLNYDGFNLGPLAAGATVSQEVSYTKSSSTLSATAVGPVIGAGARASTAVPEASTTTGWLPWAAGAAALGLVLVGGGGLWYARTRFQRGPGGVRRPARPVRHARSQVSRAGQVAGRRPAPSPVVPGAAPAVTKSTPTATLEEASTRFCIQCGRRHEPGDRFCRQCGTPVRE